MYIMCITISYQNNNSNSTGNFKWFQRLKQHMTLSKKTHIAYYDINKQKTLLNANFIFAVDLETKIHIFPQIISLKSGIF